MNTIQILSFLLLASLPQAQAQQSLFNVPSGEITPRHQTFIQEQLSFAEVGNSNLTFEYGIIPEYFEMGFDLYQIQTYRNADPSPTSPSFLLNAQFGIPINRWARILFSTTQGATFDENKNPNFKYATQNFLVARLGDDDAGHYVVGFYTGNSAYLGPESPVGPMIGYEIPIVGERFMLMGDAIFGTNDASVAVLGFQSMIDKNHKFQIAGGWQIPMPESGNQSAFVLELTFRPQNAAIPTAAPFNLPIK